ncbi:TetR/AcrR family transcriptional regulator C-terminal domain-containing protein [Streptococcus danieliae]|uniref:TetR/AcrR family transcriptional regulator C-terminal domain-containing protein n=1 Tax=Streptococcus danieliae TaxID=747656 RepID=A0A7Z0S4K9_9STRE|nr:TetR/AcrR family transcriptional regulator C-terminal domain-containing protein [Streptococcus danieliae]MBF0699335.1 TetR/AcrR family transcriptional regulator C-terminal domain-containing protein [Streptococcus danieliae]NYS96511.1 TetR/AcrR family transcriptional regulator C-terminal domain-containing protein [Streptococcus danieliae]
MGMSQFSKRAFADAFENMLISTPIEKIRITHLAKKVGTSPQTFYYHFKDKYDLIAWIYLQDYANVTSNQTQTFSATQLLQMNMVLHQRKHFYRKVFTDQSQNAIEGYAITHQMKHLRKAVTEWQSSPITIDQEMAILYHQYGVLNLFKDWLFDRLPIDVHTLSQFQYDRTPDFLKKALNSDDFENLQ